MCQPATEVLVVDPDRRVRAGLRTLLAAGGFVISGEASGTTAARAAARGRPPGAAVVDPLLPGLSRGCELISWLVTEFGTVVVALTSDPGARGAALSSGASRVLMKGCEPDAVLAALGWDPRRAGSLGDAQLSSMPNHESLNLSSHHLGTHGRGQGRLPRSGLAAAKLAPSVWPGVRMGDGEPRSPPSSLAQGPILVVGGTRPSRLAWWTGQIRPC